MIQERRQFARRPAEDNEAAIFAMFSVRVIDISVDGVLLESNNEMQPGERGRLSVSLAGVPFRALVHVRRVEAPDARGCCRAGATFVALAPELKARIERFIAQ